MDYVIKLANDVAETSFLANAEYVSTAMCERLHAAEQVVNIIKTISVLFLDLKIK